MNFPDILRLLQVAFGIGLVIFVHEGGHYIAARLCGVRVDVFSLGFGPKIFGWQRGETLYQLAAVPFGGYVRMAGDVPDGSGRPPHSWELNAKSVPQRFFIYSGGVLMNLVFALVAFPIVFGVGVQAQTPLVRAIPGTPAWEAGIPSGSRVIEVNDRTVWDFGHVIQDVAIGGSDDVQLKIQHPGEELIRDYTLTPAKNEELGFFLVGLRAAPNAEHELGVTPDSPAAKAGIQDHDRLLGVVGASEHLTPVQQWRLAQASLEPITVRVARGSAGEVHECTIEPVSGEPASDAIFGIGPISTRVYAVRAGTAAERLGVRPDDRIVKLNGAPVWTDVEFYNALLAGAGEVALEIERDGARELLEPVLFTAEERASLVNDLALAADTDGSYVVVSPFGGAAKAGLRTGDRLRELAESPVTRWEDIKNASKNAVQRGGELTFAYEREVDGTPSRRSLVAVASKPTPLEYGCDLAEPSYIYRTHGLTESISAGVRASWRMMTDAWLTLEKMFTREVDTKNMGGFITISHVSYTWSALGWTKLLFFLCILSVNLAVLNVLPIPVLDGGHLFFLLVEGIKGSPVSERTLGYSQVVGLVLILSLMVYVTYNDIMRLIGP